MKSKEFYWLSDLIKDLEVHGYNVHWDDTMPDIQPERSPLFYGSEDEVYTQDTHYCRPNHNTPEGWIARYTISKYDAEHDQNLTLAHYMKDNRHLIGKPCTEAEKQRMLAWKAAHPDKIKIYNDRHEASSRRKQTRKIYNASPDHKLKHKLDMRIRFASEWMIDNDITLESNSGFIKVFQANTPYKWSTVEHYYRGLGGQTSAKQDGWYKLD